MSTLSSQIANLSPEQLAKLAYELKAAKRRKTSTAPEIPRRATGDFCPLSFAQQRLWFISQLEPDDPSYNCIEALRMTGKLNVPLLEQTFNEVIRRHEALRTTFEFVAGDPVQIVSSEIKLDPTFIDLEALPAGERERQVSRLACEARQRPFDLTRGPLLRVVLLRLSKHEHAVVFTTHHIISDGWSSDVLVHEIIDLYSAFAEGRPSLLSELPLQYADFAIWQRERLTGPVLEGHLDYWRQNLEGAPQVLALPTDRPRPAVFTRRGSSEFLVLSPELSHSLRTLGHREGVTLFMTMLAAFDVLLSRYSGQTDFLIGTDIANRNHDTTEPLIGFFVNQLVLRADLAGDPTFNQLLQRVKEVTLNGYAHQEMPFEKVVDLLNPERNLSHAPVFQVKLVLQNASTGDLELPELTIGAVDFESDIAKFDLTLVITEAVDRIVAEIEYSTDLFERSTVSRMLTQFERLLASAVKDPEQHLSQLELLGSAERHQLLVERNDTDIPYPHTRCIQELFEEQVADSPDKLALIFHDQHLSYTELNTRANQLAHYLRQVGVNAEIPVGVCLNRSIDMVVAVFAILKAGGVYIPLDPQYPAERLICILDEVQPSIILTDSSLIDELPSTGAQGICLDTDQEWWSELPDCNLPVTELAELTGENLAHVLYTSGSTGKPKGVAVPHRGVVRLVSQETYVTYGPDEVFLQMGSLSFDASTLEIFSALLTGGRLVLLPPGAPSLDDLATVLTSEGVSKLWITAGLFHPMVEHQADALAGVQDVMSGGDVLSGEHVRRLLTVKAGYGSVINGYGPTESTVFTCCHRVSSEDELERGVPIGKPIGNTKVYVLGEKMELLADGMVGELYVGGDGLARCYYNQPELTAERFVPNPFSTRGGERLYRTGDHVRWRADGLMEFVGRVDTQVKIRGFRIEPGEVEAVLGQHASVSDCAVVARQESDGEKYLVAYVVTKANGHSESTFELREYLRERLPDFMVPAAIVAIESLPLTQNGKVDRRELSAREVQVAGEGPYVPPRTATEEMLCEIWQEVLGAERVGIEDNFFDLGGDSILTIQVIVKARAVGLELNVQQLFQYQTVNELAQELERSIDSSVTVGEIAAFSLISEEDRLRLPAGLVDAYPLTALQAGMLFHSELAPDAGLYHDIFSFHLKTPFDDETLRATLQQLIDLHPVLRTSFNLSDFGEPIQLVHREVAVPLRIGDLRSLSETEQKEYLAEWMAAERRHRFDWHNAPLMRFQIDRRTDESFQFSFSFHHAILDGWSVATMLTELFQLYSSVLQRDEGAISPPLSASFRDYVAAEQAILNSEEARQYWTGMLSEATQSRLPRLAKSAGPSRVVGHNVEISPELALALKELASTAGVPLKSVLLAAHLRALSVHTGGDDVVTGIVSHGRTETEDGERVLGLFLNTLPFRRRLAGGTWLQLVQETFEAERELLTFRRYPMARMQQDIANDTALFEVIFNFVHFHVYEKLQNVSGLEVLDFDLAAKSNYTLAVDFSLNVTASKIGLEFSYDAAELSAGQIEVLGRAYLTILESMSSSPLERYDQRSLLSHEERQRILYDWNDSATPDLHSECYHNLFEAQVARTPDAVAAILGAEQLTYDELNSRANQLAHYLQAAAVGPEVPVGVLLDRSLDTIVALLATFKAGGVYVPLDAQQPAERLQYLVADAGLAMLLTHTRFKDRLSSTVRTIYLDLEQQAIAEQSTRNVASAVDPSNLAYVIYTSGSTGRPKGVAVPHDAFVRHCLGIKDHYELQPGDRKLVFASFSFDVSLEEMLPTLLAGASLIVRGDIVWTPKEFVRTLSEQHITVINLPPAYWHKLTQDCIDAGDFDSKYDLRLVHIGGEAVLPETVRLWQNSAMRSVRLLDVYGPTETVVTATSFEVPTPLPDTFALATIPIGRPLATRAAYILDSHGQPAPVGVPGELHLGGPIIARGYLNRPDLTAEKFIPDVFADRPGARLYRTGDLARYLPDGNIEFLGRMDQQVKLRGFRIELGEIEAVLKQHETVREAVVILHEAQRLIAYVQLRAAGEVGSSELRAYLKERLPEYMLPGSFVEVTEFALTPSGKINRRALPAPESILAEEAEYEEPRTPTEDLLSGLWANVLRVNRVGINDNFFELGGHSLSAIQLISRIRDAFSVELPLSELFERRTVAELAQSIDAQMRASHELMAPPLLPAIREADLPLSFAQQRLWFLDQLVPENIAYNIVEALRLGGELNVAALEQSISEVMRRHEAVRTTFPDVGGNPIQAITPFSHLALPLVDLSSLSDEDRKAQVVRFASTESQRPFDLQSGPLLRVILLRLAADDHVLLFSVHHIASDEWSTSILTKEVTALYDAFSSGNASPLTDLAIQYGDFAVWQREWLSGDVLARQLDYWTSKLQGVPPLFALPTDYPRPKVQRNEGAFDARLLSTELTLDLKSLAQQSKSTLFMTIMAAFQTLLYRYAQQATIVTGTTVANRTRREIEPLIGFFVNTLVLRSDFDDDPTFLTHLNRLRKHALEAYSHQDLPFEMLIDELKLPRDLSYHPLFQVMFSWEGATLDELALTGLELGTVNIENHTSQFDLTLRVGEVNGQLRCSMQYNTALFEASTISRMLAQFERLLSSAVRDPEQHVSELELLSSTERHQLLVERNETNVAYPHTRCIHELFEAQVALSPDAPALTFHGEQLTYAELNIRANQLAHYLSQLGVKAETPIGVCLNRSIEMVVALLGILKAGGAYVPLDPEYPTERLAFILEDLSPPIILTDSSLVDEMPSTWAQTLCLDTESELWSALPTTELADLVISSDNIAYVMYTSGSTGKPKGVAVSHRAVGRLVKQCAYVDFGPREVFLQLAPVTFDASTLELWGALLNGGRLVLMPPGAPNLTELGTVLKTEGVTVLWLTAGLFHLMVEQELEALASVTQVIAGGDVLSVEHVRRLLRAKGGSGAVINGYGPTETTTFACCHRMSGETELEFGVPIGSPIGNTQVYVLGEQMELVGTGMLGELYIGGDGLARGYFNRPGLTAERFVPHPFSTADGERLYRTGDYVRWRADETLEFVGRRDTQVKIRGFRVEPGEVEAALGRHGAVKECVVVTRRESNGEKRLVAYVVDGNNEQALHASELREYLRERLPEFMVPAAIVQLESLPLTPNGKVDRRELAAREVRVGGERSYVPPRTITEELLCGIWVEVLRAERVGIHDNFFELGGDSILTIQVIVKARAVGLELNVQQLFQYQTVQNLAQELGRSHESSAAVAVIKPFSLISEEDRLRLPAGVVDAYPLTALQAGMLFHGELMPEAGQYHDIFSFHLRMPFDDEALRATLQQLIDLHPVLRTSFNLSDFSEPIQLVHQEVAVPLQIGDLRSLSPTEQEEHLAEWMAAEKRNRFDWHNAPLMRFQIDRRTDESFQFSFGFHHAILDGWSVATMLTELFQLYSSVSHGEDRLSAAPVSASFRDYVAAEQATLNSEEARQYWAMMLSDATQSRLPRPGLSVGPSRKAVHSVEISRELSLALKELARTAGVPLKSVLLAAHLRALHVHTGGDEVLTGIVSHGRTETEDGERVLGLFLNTLPFRRRLAGGTWLQLVRETFAAERDQLPFRRYPMARMQQDIGNDTALFEVTFNFVHFHVYEELQNVSDLEVLGIDGVAETNYTLAVDFSLELEGSQVRLDLQYDAAELSAEQIEVLGRDYLTILESMTSSPLERYEQRSLLSSDERQKLLVQWNDRRGAYEFENCIHQLFEAQVASTPNAVAAVLDAEQLTYDELNSRANQLAHYLQARGVGPDVPVGVLIERSLETIVALLAIFKAGGAYLPLDPEYPDERLKFMVRDAGLELLVTNEKLSSRLAGTVMNVRVDADWQEIANESQDNPPLLANASNLAYIIYTSGSTGTPKGAMVTHGGVLNSLQWKQQRYELTEQDAFLMHTSLNFDPSVWEVFWPLMVGARVVIAPAGMLESSALLRYMAEQSVTCAYFVPSQLGVLVQDRRLSEVSSLRYVVNGGEKLPLGVMQEFQELSRAQLIHSYGPTEVTVGATEWVCEVGAERVLIGRPIGNTQTYVLDGHMEPLPVGVSGELYIGGVGVGRGYAGQAELTAERFVPDRFSGNEGARLYRTGDMVRYDDEGNLEFVGRVDEQVKLRGYRIELGEIEAVLRRHEQVRAAVVALRERDGDKRLVAYMVGDAQHSELRQHLKEQLPAYMVPSFFVDLDELPLMPNGKINRRALPAPESIFAEEGEYEEPRTPTEDLLSGLWANVLRVSRVGINDNFFELGGHSLLAIQLISRIRDAFSVELPLSELFERRTVAELAQSIDDHMRASHELVAPPLLPAIREDVLPLSFAQQRLWFLDQLVPDNIAYNVAGALRFGGGLNVAALEQSISEVTRRHEAFRTTFPDVGGNPIQVIAPFRHLALPLVDLSSLADEDREAQAVRLASAEAQRPFDLQSGPLLRVKLLRLGVEDHALLFSMHHIISDGWSNSILVNEVTALYDAFTSGTGSPFADLVIQYADFAVWQRQWLSGDVLARQLDYWTNKLQGVPALLALPTDFPRPKVQRTEGAFSTRLFSAELTSDLKSLTQQSGTTLYMTMLAAFHALLHRYAQQDSIVTGTPAANRTRIETEPLIGFFVNTLVLRSDFYDDPTFLTHLGRLRKHALEAYALQDLPFDLLVDELQLARDLSYNPLFQVMFSWEEPAFDELALTGLELGTLAVENRTSQFDLTLRMGEVNGRLQGAMQYNTALFEASTIDRLLGHFEQLLASVVREPRQRISELSLLTDEEQQQLLVEWNDTRTSYDRAASVVQLFEEQVDRTPDALALVYKDERLSFAALNRRANQLARYLRRAGIAHDSRVALCMERSIEMVVGILGALKAGGAYVPLDPAYPRERLRFMLEDAAVEVLVTQSQVHDRLKLDAHEVLLLDQDWDEISQEADDDLAVALTPENLAYVIYTSGSSGVPKGVMVQHGSVVNLAAALKHAVYDELSDGPFRVGLNASLAFDASVKQWVQLLAGNTLVLVPEESRREGQEMLAYVEEQQIAVLDCTPAQLQILLEAGFGQQQPSSLIALLVGGEAITAELWEQLRQDGRLRYFNVYGPTECTVDATVCLLQRESARVMIGRPVTNVQTYILDQQQQAVPVGVVGELYIGGAGVARGYLDQPGLTAERFVPDAFGGEAGARVYRTGDQARYLSDGQIEFAGRADGQIKVRGYRIELGEIDSALRQLPGISNAAAVVHSDNGNGNRIVGYVVADAGLEIKVDQLQAQLKQQLPDFMLPAVLVALDALPQTGSGKVDRRALAELKVSGDAQFAESYREPRTPVEEGLCGLWQELLGIERVGVNDNFFELGGHSLLATQLVSRVRATFGVELRLRELFERPTVAGLAEQVEAALRGSVSMTAQPLVPVSRAQQLPLSYAQERLWFLDQLEPESIAYNIPRAVRLKGRLDVAALERTLNEVVRRHEVLRTRFVAVNGAPVQVISPAGQLEMPRIDLSELPEEQQKAKVSQLAAAEAQQPFDLSVGPLLRVQLLRLGTEDHVVLFTVHHIISDGWSSGILVREVGALYEAYIEGHESPLPELGIQYADYAVWQREWLQGEVLDQQLAYWRQQLGEELPVLQLSTDRPRPPVQSYRGRTLSFTLPAQLTAELKKLSNAEGVTLYMTLLAVFNLLLWRYSGQSDVVVGTPIAGRNQLATEGLIGLFVNTLVLRTRLSGNPSFSELLERVREVTLGAYAHQDLPFEKLVEELQPERDMSRSPLFQVMFVLQNTTMETFRLRGLEAIGIGGEDETAKFDLTMGLAEVQGELHGSLQYNVDLFGAATVERLVQHFELLLRDVVNDPDRQLSQLPLLIEEDRHKLLVEWNDTAVAYDLDKCIHQLFEAQVSRMPDAVALVAGDSRLSYADLDSRAESLARRLRREGIGPEQRVGVLVRRSAAMVVAVLGVLKAGGAYVPLDAGYPLERLSLMADDAQLSVLVVQEGLEVDFARPDLKLVLVNGATGECVDEELGEWEELSRPHVIPENLAYVIYTSGSTGRPKGVAITHRSAVAFMHWAKEVFSPSALAGVLASTSLNFDLSVFELFVTFSSGGKIILADNALHLPTLEAAHEVTLINTVPSAMAELLRIGAVPDSVHTINLAGEALPESLVQEIYKHTGVQQVWNLYGPSEDTTYSTSALIKKNQSGPMVIGRPIANTKAYICDETLQLVPAGVAGQLLLAGDGLARGYIGRPDLTAERFLPNPFGSKGGSRLYFTGDLARYRADGQIEFLGRADSQVKLRGFRIEPGEIETVLREHASVRDAAVITATEDGDDKRLVAYVVTAQSGASVNDLPDYLRGRLPDYMVPSAFVLMDAFPLTPNGKIDRRALPSHDQLTKSDSELTTPRDVLELQLTQIWKEVLRREQIGLRDNFFDLGGHSLLAVRLLHKVERLVDRKIPLSILFQGSTIEQLAATLRQHGGKIKEQSLVSIQPQGSMPPLFLVHSASGNAMSYVALSRELGREQPVYGLQSRGLDPDRKPTARIEDMASEYLQELTAVQPEGPYHLGGWSMGGVIAFEMAQQLIAGGKSVAPIVLIDSTIQTGRVKKNGLDDASLLLALAQHHGLFLDDTDETFEDLSSLNLDEQLELFLEKAVNSNLIPRDIGLSQLRHLFELFKVNVRATENYRPAKSAQPVILFQPAGALPDAAKKLRRWKKVAEVVTAHRLPGDHYSLLTEPNVSLLAEQITPYLSN